MIRIEISPYEQKDILEMLDYAKEQKLSNKPILRGSHKWDDSGYWELRIEYLKKVVLGKGNKPSIYKSSFEYVEKRNEQRDLDNN